MPGYDPDYEAMQKDAEKWRDRAAADGGGTDPKAEEKLRLLMEIARLRVVEAEYEAVIQQQQAEVRDPWDARDHINERADDLLDGLPPDLVRVLRDPAIIVPQDQAVFELIARWANAQSDTPSALLTVYIDGHCFVGAGVKPEMTGSEIRLLALPAISNHYDLFVEQPNSPSTEDRLILHADVVRIVPGMRFFSAPKVINAG